MSASADGPLYVRSPEIHDDRRVTLRYFAPEAKQVNVVCNVPAINQTMQRDDQGIWSLTVGPLPPNTYAYHFQVDGAVVVDPVNRHTKPWLWVDNILEVPGANPAIHQLQDVPHGQIHTRWYRSPQLSQTRRLFIYTPPGYDKNDEPFPVLFLLHGCGDDESAWTHVGQVHHLADNLLAAGKSKPMVIVMPFGHDTLPESPDFEIYDCSRNYQPVEKEFFSGVVPFVETEYRLSKKPSERAIAGLSMGGGQAIRLGLSNPQKFHWVAGFSSSIEKHKIENAVESLLPNHRKQNTWLWLGCGKQDFLFEETVAFDQWLTDHKVRHTTLIDAGNHDWRTWRSYLATILPQLFQPR